MKSSRTTTSMQSKQGVTKKPRPEIRDNMDSRQNKEMSSGRQVSKKGHLKKNEN